MSLETARRFEAANRPQALRAREEGTLARIGGCVKDVAGAMR